VCDQEEEDDIDWAKGLEMDSRGNFLSSSANLNLIFRKDPRLKGKFRMNEFDVRWYVVSDLAWRLIERPQPFEDVDYAGLRNYFDTVYGISGSQKIDDALALEFERNKWHPVREYLKGLRWDGLERLDNLLIDFLGCEDNVYHREIIRKALVGAVARINNPGVKFELVLTLIGSEGVGKSTLIKKLGGQWFSDSFHTMHGREAFESLEGAWLIEMAELSGLKKTEVEAVKHFISKQEDNYRPAYGRVKKTYRRQCVFFGTTNETDFLKGSTGNRRFLPAQCRPDQALMDVWECLDQDYVDQVWAEAKHYYQKGEPLYLSKEVAAEAFDMQAKHTSVDDRQGLIEEYLDTLLPEDWRDKDIFERRSFLLDPIAAKGKVIREFVCVAEIWCECLGKPKEEMDRYKTRDINEIMRSLKGWVASNETMYFKNYGKQRFYARRK